ncbi:MAG: radical SAM protein [Desulfobacteraceae bacterium]|nr:radical SAM protein [Desulfobacteraceae bacterium]
MSVSVKRLAAGLFINGLKFRYLKLTGKPGRPQTVSLEITHNCIARCIMCNIWRIPRDVPDLSVNQWLGFLDSDLFSDLRELDITGGEPFIRDDLAEFFYGICELKKTRLRSLRSIAVTTNGLLTKRVLDITERILPELENAGLDLVVVCGMDAAGELHDRIRNVDNAWTKVNSTLEGLLELKRKHANFVIGLKTTILPLNIDELERISSYAEKKGLFTIISPAIITPGRYLNREQADILTFSNNDIRKMVSFFSKHHSQWLFHADTLLEYWKTGRVNKPCTCGFNYFFVRYSGEMHLCPLATESIGNITDIDPEELLRSKKAYSLRRKIGRFDSCQSCTEPGLERYALVYEGWSYLVYLMKMQNSRFLHLHSLMGLDKYTD